MITDVSHTKKPRTLNRIAGIYYNHVDKITCHVKLTGIEVNLHLEKKFRNDTQQSPTRQNHVNIAETKNKWKLWAKPKLSRQALTRIFLEIIQGPIAIEHTEFARKSNKNNQIYKSRDDSRREFATSLISQKLQGHWTQYLISDNLFNYLGQLDVNKR